MAGAIRFGVIGSGFMGQTWARVIARHVPEATLIAVGGGRRAGDVATAARSRVPRARGLARDEATSTLSSWRRPVPTHRPLAEAAARAGKHVLVEKPMTNTRADADAMVAAADAAGVRLAVVSQHRFRGAPMAARAADRRRPDRHDPDDPRVRAQRRLGHPGRTRGTPTAPRSRRTWTGAPTPATSSAG